MSNTDWEFIFDGIFGFLSSPIWNVPVSSFIEEKSVVFQETDENHLAWTEVHKRYSNLVESLISSYLNDMGITDEQFLEACKMPSVQHHPAMQNIFEQLWAADDFEIFKRMMIQKNLELQLQALEMIRKRQGKKSSKKKKVKPSKKEDEVLAEVMKQTEIEYQEMQKEAGGEGAVANSNYNETMEKLISESNEQVDRLENEVLLKQEETKQVVEESISRESLPEKEKNDAKNDSSTSTNNNKVEEATTKQPEDEKKEEKTVPKSASSKKPEVVKPRDPLKPLKVTNPSSADLAADWIKQAKAENPTPSSSAATSTPLNAEEDMDKRAAYLIQQRDRLLELKRKEREKQLNQYTKTQAKARPSSARVAKQAIGGGETSAQPSASAAAAQPSAEELKRMAMRKALAAKLKKEVINK